MQKETSADQALELATLKALRGAHELRGKLLLDLASGNPSIADLAYAVKVRVKDDFKIREKVLRKRAMRPEYDVANLRDIIGLRVVTLYRLDALEVIPLLINSIEAPGPNGVFKAGSLEEVVIYSTNPQGDPQELAQKLMRLLRSRGLDAISRVDEAASNYTSIHMVAWGQVTHGTEQLDIPVEIQVRTAFEDVWGEMDHALKYKRERTFSSPDAVSDWHDTALAHLNVLKTLVDGIGQYADQVRLQIHELDKPRLRSALSKSAEDPLVRLSPLRDLPRELRDEVQGAVADARPALEAGPNLTPAAKVRMLQASLERLDAAAEALAARPELAAKTVRETDYVISMQRALMLFEVGNALESGGPQLAQAIKIYESMEARFPRRVVIKYRLAKVLDAAGDRSRAIEKLRAVLLQLEKRREPLSPKHWIRSAAPRILGVLLWEEADALARAEDGAPESNWTERRVALLREAYDVTRKAYDQKVKEETPAAEGLPTERAKSANNLLYYALEFLDALKVTGPLSDIEKVSAAEIRRFLKAMGAEDPASLNDARLLDTAKRAYIQIGDLARARAAAQRFLELAPTQLPADDIHTEEMVAAARSLLERGL